MGHMEVPGELPRNLIDCTNMSHSDSWIICKY
jgi:hypothetical protein